MHVLTSLCRHGSACQHLGGRVSSLVLRYGVCLIVQSFDVELPLEVDDEYYDEAKGEWAQPSGEVRLFACTTLSRCMISLS